MLLVIGVIGTSSAALAADGVLSREELTPGSYCHEKFPAIRPSTLGDQQAELKGSTTGDTIDYYGPCDQNPRGQGQIASQELEQQHEMEGSLGGGEQPHA